MANNKKPQTFMLDPDVIAAIEAAVSEKRISKSAYINQLLADVLLGATLQDISADILAPSAKPNSGKRTGAGRKRA